MEIHGDEYDYSKVEYVKALEKVIIICKKHGLFYQKPSLHLTGHGCAVCGGSVLKTTSQFIQEAKEIHGDKYNYDQVEYINTKTKVNIICPNHGKFEQNPHDHIAGHGCDNCSGTYLKTTAQFIQESKEIHGDKYDYSKVEYINAKSKVNIICSKHGEFEQIASSHLFGQGCSNCGNLKKSLSKRKPVDDFTKRACNIHGDTYDYSEIEYIDLQTPIKIICKIHGGFMLKPTKHIHRHQGCPKCQRKKNYSKSQMQWLNFMSEYNNIHIQHAENDGEFIIQTTKFKADGYCQETNTIYEFHGDYWHGNPKVFNTQEYNKTTNCSFGELYEKTLEREKMIKELGYNLVVIWEYDWDKINKSIKFLQNKFKPYH